jgi:hypothetical protein
MNLTLTVNYSSQLARGRKLAGRLVEKQKSEEVHPWIRNLVSKFQLLDTGLALHRWGVHSQERNVQWPERGLSKLSFNYLAYRLPSSSKSMSLRDTWGKESSEPPLILGFIIRVRLMGSTYHRRTRSSLSD